MRKVRNILLVKEEKKLDELYYLLSPWAVESWPVWCEPDDEDDDDDDDEDAAAYLAKFDFDGGISLADRAIFLPTFVTASPEAATS